MNPTKNTADKLFLRRRIIGLELCLLRTQKKMSLSEAANQSQYTRIIKLETTIIPKKTNFYRYGLTRIITRRLRSRFPGIGFPKASSLGY